MPTFYDAGVCGLATADDVEALRGLADGEGYRCSGRGGQHAWVRDDELELDGVQIGGWIVDGVTPIYDPQVPVI